MYFNVYDWDSIPGADRRLYSLSRKRAQELVLSGAAKFLALPDGRRVIQKLPPIEMQLERVGFNEKNLIAFGRGPLGIWQAPDKLHYEIPRAGDRTIFARHRRRLVRVSSRNQIWPGSRLQPLPSPALAAAQ